MSLVIGVTGNIACGKSTVAEIFKQLGIKVLDSDEVVHEIYVEDEQTKKELLAEFGTCDRKEIGKQVFGRENAKRRKILEAIIHPKVDSVFRAWVKANQKEVFLVNIVPLLFEAKLEHRYDRIITVFTTKAIQLQRLKLRNPELSEEDMLRRIESQLDIKEKLRKSDFTIDNSSNFDDLDIQVEEILEQIRREEKLDFPIKSKKAS